MTTTKLPTLFLAHGGGPLPLIGKQPEIAQFLSSIKSLSLGSCSPPLKAIVVITAHWEEKVVTVSTNANPKLLYDYSGFPESTYKLQYPAPGHPELAKQILAKLQEANIPCSPNEERGFDHGTFVPLMLAFPEAEIPVVQMSLAKSLDPSLHIKVGEALSFLREENVLVIGSGYSFHNMAGFFNPGAFLEKAARFDEWLRTSMTNPSKSEREKALENWQTEAPFGRDCHPREEHLLPLMVVVGASGDSKGHTIFHQSSGLQVSAFRFGEIWE